MAEPKYLTVDRLSLADITRIFSKISVDPVKGCWLWTAGLNRFGYGKVKYKSRTEAPHRLMWAWLVGPLQMGRARDIPNLDHIVCDTKRCCFPAHLKLGSMKDNLMRSTANAAAKNARKTHCQLGHELPTVGSKSEGRVCPTCRKAWHQSDRYKKWNADFGRAYHQARRYGPERDAFLKRQRENMRVWKAKNRGGQH